MPKRFFLPTQLIHGAGALKELGKFVSKDDNVIVVTDKGLVKVGLVEKLLAELATIGATWAVFDDIEPNPHADTVRKALAFAKEQGVNTVVTIGGGSPMDVAKVVAMLLTNEGDISDYQWNGKAVTKPPATLVAIPTTAGTGSEVTRTAVIIDRNTKKGIGNDALFPKAALVDPELMVSLPPQITAFTGMDALTHAIEAYVGLGANPATDAWALQAIELLVEYLPKAFANGADLEAREKVALASSMAGAAMDQAGLGFIHAMSGPLSSYYDVPHGLSNAVLLPYGMQFNLIAAPKKMARIAQLFGVDTFGMSLREAAQAAVDAVEQLCRDLEIPADLSSYCQAEEDIEKFAVEAINMFLMRNNPRRPRVSDCADVFRKVLLPEK
ncbi:iron-containing alcohol dehydrogenase family protein [Zhaonella formicivorans]|uniref:iron-containing alcohol dehydrogenase family protein n=1 Tax=Zhaonella formicivorans TaxID=2528593 RepID=UPI0010E57B42|nr:iron-containing alcohol dehydrogenase [Zhaonella formicivorans]